MSYYLSQEDDILFLKSKENNFSPFCVDFSKGAVGYRQKKVGSSNELLFKALGRKKDLSILDACAGWGTDAFIMASLGNEVLCLEKNPMTFQLLQDGLRRALLDKKIESQARKIKVLNEAFEFFVKKTKQSFDVIYLDPMFEGEKSSALPKKEMQLLQALTLGHESVDVQTLVKLALDLKPARVILKRPLDEKEIGIKKFSVIEGKNIRFDIFKPN